MVVILLAGMMKMVIMLSAVMIKMVIWQWWRNWWLWCWWYWWWCFCWQWWDWWWWWVAVLTMTIVMMVLMARSVMKLMLIQFFSPNILLFLVEKNQELSRDRKNICNSALWYGDQTATNRSRDRGAVQSNDIINNYCYLFYSQFILDWYYWYWEISSGNW